MKKQLEALMPNGQTLLTSLALFHRFSERAYPPSFPFHTHRLVATMADAAEHDEELVDYDEEEVG